MELYWREALVLCFDHPNFGQHVVNIGKEPTIRQVMYISKGEKFGLLFPRNRNIFWEIFPELYA